MSKKKEQGLGTRKVKVGRPLRDLLSSAPWVKVQFNFISHEDLRHDIGLSVSGDFKDLDKWEDITDAIVEKLNRR